MIPRLKPDIGIDEFKACFSWSKADAVDHFESTFAALMGQKYALAFPYGRTGLLLLLNALGLKNKEIICPAYTCVVVPHAISLSMNKPVFLDCEPTGFNMDLNKIDSMITSETGAIIATSLFGYPVDLDKINEIRIKHPHVHIIQDCAHSFAAEWKGRPVHKAGDVSLFGLNISKILTSVFGGMIATDNKSIYVKLRRLRNATLKKSNLLKEIRRSIYLLSIYPVFNSNVYSMINRLERTNLLNYFVKYYDNKIIDMPKDYLFKMSSVEARVGSTNCSKYDTIIAKRRQAAHYYFENLKDDNDITLPPKIDGATYSHFVVLVRNRNEFLLRGLDKGIQLGWIVEYSIPEMPAYGNHDPSEFPNSAKYSRSAINLPVWGGRKIASRVISRIFN